MRVFYPAMSGGVKIAELGFQWEMVCKRAVLGAFLFVVAASFG